METATAPTSDKPISKTHKIGGQTIADVLMNGLEIDTNVTRASLDSRIAKFGYKQTGVPTAIARLVEAGYLERIGSTRPGKNQAKKVKFRVLKLFIRGTALYAEAAAVKKAKAQ